jgi:hypothetical protein
MIENEGKIYAKDLVDEPLHIIFNPAHTLAFNDKFD